MPLDLARHLDEYRTQVKAESLEGAPDYAKQKTTRRPDLYPTVYDYLSQSMQGVRAAVAGGSEEHYRLWLSRHQEAMISLFETMVADEMWDYKLVTADNILALIDEKGWTWFKFCAKSLEFVIRLEDKVVDVLFVPRYAEKYKRHWTQAGKAIFDANEMGTIFKGSAALGDLRRRLGRHVLETKLAAPGQKITAVRAGDAIVVRPIDRLNMGDSVEDWTLPLW